MTTVAQGARGSLGAIQSSESPNRSVHHRHSPANDLPYSRARRGPTPGGNHLPRAQGTGAPPVSRRPRQARSPVGENRVPPHGAGSRTLARPCSHDPRVSVERLRERLRAFFGVTGAEQALGGGSSADPDEPQPGEARAPKRAGPRRERTAGLPTTVPGPGHSPAPGNDARTSPGSRSPGRPMRPPPGSGLARTILPSLLLPTALPR